MMSQLDSGNDVALSGHTPSPEPVLTQFSVTKSCHKASMAYKKDKVLIACCEFCLISPLKVQICSTVRLCYNKHWLLQVILLQLQ